MHSLWKSPTKAEWILLYNQFVANKARKAKSKPINELNTPQFGESLVDIFDITGRKTDFSKYPLTQSKTRYFKDEKGVFKEMDEEKDKKSKIVIAE